MAGTSVFGIIVGKLSHKKEMRPIILLKIDKALEIGFYHTIFRLSLAIYLEIKGDGELLLDA